MIATTSIQGSILFGTLAGVFGGALLKNCYDDVKEKNGRQKCYSFPFKKALIGTGISLLSIAILLDTFSIKKPEPKSGYDCDSEYKALFDKPIKKASNYDLHQKLKRFNYHEIFCNTHDPKAQIAKKYKDSHELIENSIDGNDFEQWFKDHHCLYERNSAAHEVHKAFFALTLKKLCL